MGLLRDHFYLGRTREKKMFSIIEQICENKRSQRKRLMRSYIKDAFLVHKPGT
jgi:hypothetical protein